MFLKKLEEITKRRMKKDEEAQSILKKEGIYRKQNKKQIDEKRSKAIQKVKKDQLDIQRKGQLYYQEALREIDRRQADRV